MVTCAVIALATRPNIDFELAFGLVGVASGLQIGSLVAPLPAIAIGS